MSATARLSRLCALLAGADEPLACECLSRIEEEEVVLSVSGELDASYAYRIYDRRWRLQREVTKGNTVAGYEQVIPALQARNGSVTIDDVVTGDATYVIFGDLDGALIGVLRSRNHDLRKLDSLRGKWAQNEAASSGARFIKGELTETW